MQRLRHEAFLQTTIALGLGTLVWFCSFSYSQAVFNGLASPLFLALTLFLLPLALRHRISASPSSLVLYLLFVSWALFAATQSGQLLPAIAMDSHWFILPIAALLIARVLRHYPQMIHAMRIAAALCIIQLLATMYANAEWYFHWFRPPIYGHIRHLGLSIGFLTVLLSCNRCSTPWADAFFRVARILGIALVVWSGTRAAMLGYVCCVVIFALSDRSHAKVLIIDTLIGTLLSLIPERPIFNGGIVGTFERTISASSIDTLSSSRLEIWQSAIDNLRELGRIWIGVGGNGYARLQTMYGAKMAFPGHIQAHNVVIQSICDWGVIGAGLLALFGIQSTLKPVVAQRLENDATALSGIVYIIFTGMLDATLYHMEHMIYLAISVAYLHANWPLNEKKGVPLPPAAIIGFLVLLATVHLLSLDYRIGLGWYFRTE